MIPYQIDGFEAKYISLSDPEGPDNAMDIRVKFRLDIKGKEHPIQVRAKLVLASNLFDRLVEVYAPELPRGVTIKADELHDAVRRYVFVFLNNEEVADQFRKDGIFT